MKKYCLEKKICNESMRERFDLSFRTDNLIVDRVSLNMLQSLGMSIPGKSPINVRGDGNCLFNSISMHCLGTRIFPMKSESRLVLRW